MARRGLFGADEGGNLLARLRIRINEISYR